MAFWLLLFMSFSFAFLSFTLFPEVGVDRVEEARRQRPGAAIRGEKKEPEIRMNRLVLNQRGLRKKSPGQVNVGVTTLSTECERTRCL